MISRLLFTILLLCLATGAWAAGGAYYYQKPDAATLPDDARVLMYDPAAGGSDKNITGAKLKSEVNGALTQGAVLGLVGQASATPLVKQAQPGASIYQRVFEIKNSSGTIIQYVNNSGQTIWGTPLALAVSSVSPASGAVNVDSITVPSVTFNKPINATLSTLYLQGNSTAPTNSGNVSSIPATLARSTTYTIKFARTSYLQEDGETSSSCGSNMTDVAGVCQSSFTTSNLIKIIDAYPQGTPLLNGTTGTALNPPLSVTFDRPLSPALTSSNFYVVASYFDGTDFQTYSPIITPTTSDNRTWTLPGVTFQNGDGRMPSAYTVHMQKLTGLPDCGVGFIDNGTDCYLQFTTAP